MSQSCPLCQGPGSVIGRLLRTDLRTMWTREFGIDPGPWMATPTLEYQLCTACDLRYFDDGLAGPEEMYGELEKLPWYYLDDKPEFEVALRHLGGAKRVLEVGAGAGAFGRLISDQAGYVGLELEFLRSRTGGGHRTRRAPGVARRPPRVVAWRV